MTYQMDCTLPDEILELITEQGLAYVPELIRIGVNAAMRIERQQYLGAAPFERSSQRRGQANGYRPKTVATRLGEITFDGPQVREGGFYPHSLEKGTRRERALKRARADMDGQGVSKRKHGLDRCLYHGEPGFERWVGWGVIANNLTKIGTKVASQPA